MVQGKPENLASPHAGFKRKKKCKAYFIPGPVGAERLGDGVYFVEGYATPAGGWAYRLTHILKWIGPDQPPTDGL